MTPLPIRSAAILRIAVDLATFRQDVRDRFASGAFINAGPAFPSCAAYGAGECRPRPLADRTPIGLPLLTPYANGIAASREDVAERGCRPTCTNGDTSARCAGSSPAGVTMRQVRSRNGG